MGDSSNSRNNPQSTSRGSNNANASPLGNRNFSPQADLDAQIHASSSPVTSAKDVSSWLGKKGWILNSEPCSTIKLADILFSAALSFKLPPEAETAIRS